MKQYWQSVENSVCCELKGADNCMIWINTDVVDNGEITSQYWQCTQKYNTNQY